MTGEKRKDYLQSNHIRLALFFLLIGVIFAIETYFKVFFLYKLWPVIILSLGIGFIGIFIKGRKRHPFFLSLGVYLSLLAGLFIFLNFTSWENIKNLWPLFVTFSGISLILNYLFSKGNRMVLFLGLSLFFLSVFFFLIFFIDYNLGWSSFILVGLSILISGKL